MDEALVAVMNRTFRAARSGGFSEADAKDCMQEVALRVIRADRCPLAAPGPRVAAYLRTHLHYVMVDARQQQCAAPRPLPGDEVPDRRVSGTDAVDAREQILSIAKHLSIGDQRVILMLLEGQLSSSTIAKTLGISDRAYRAKRARIIKRMRIAASRMRDG